MWSSLDKKHGYIAVFGKAAGDDTARSASARIGDMNRFCSKFDIDIVDVPTYNVIIRTANADGGHHKWSEVQRAQFSIIP